MIHSSIISSWTLDPPKKDSGLGAAWNSKCPSLVETFGGTLSRGGGKSWLKYMGLETGNPIPSMASHCGKGVGLAKPESPGHLKPVHKCHPLVNLPAAEGDTPNLYIGLFISAYQW